jgi:hypothetical protein
MPADTATNPWILPAVVGLISGLFSGLLGRRLEAWWFKPILAVDFIPEEGGFRTEGSWKKDGEEYIEIYIRARVRNSGRIIAKRCRPYLVKLEEVLHSGTPSTQLYDSLMLRWPGQDDYEPRDIPNGVNQFFDVVGVLKNTSGWRFACEKPFPLSSTLSTYRGTYRFTVLVTGDGVIPAGRKIDVTYSGDWNNLRAVDAGPVKMSRRT